MSHAPKNERADSYEVGYKKPPKHTQFQKGYRPPKSKLNGPHWVVRLEC